MALEVNDVITVTPVNCLIQGTRASPPFLKDSSLVSFASQSRLECLAECNAEELGPFICGIVPGFPVFWVGTEVGTEICQATKWRKSLFKMWMDFLPHRSLILSLRLQWKIDIYVNMDGVCFKVLTVGICGNGAPGSDSFQSLCLRLLLWESLWEVLKDQGEKCLGDWALVGACVDH